MTYQVLARKWRPQIFDQVVGQADILKALVHALDENRLHHAYLFTGTRGVGKTTIARIVAKCLNCEKGVSSEPCGICEACVEISEGRFVDLIEIDAASRTKVEDTREILDNVQYAPSKGRFKVYLIDEVHMLSTHSFNALLKTLEEPPPYVKFLLATTDPHKLPITVLSRCLQFHLKHIDKEVIAKDLARILTTEKIDFEMPALSLIAKAAQGSMRDALSLLDQAISQGDGRVQAASTERMLGQAGEEVPYALMQAVLANDADALFQLSAHLAEHPVDYAQILNDLSRLLFEVAQVKVVKNPLALEFDPTRLQAFAKALPPELIQVLYQIAVKGKNELHLAPDFKTGFEMTLLRLIAFRPMDEIQLPPLSKKIAEAPKKNPSPLVGEVGQAELGRMRGKAAIAPASPVLSVAMKELDPVQPASLPHRMTDKNSWHDIVEALPLTGMLRQFALNCALVLKDGNKVKLALDKAHEAMLHARYVDKLKEALTHFYNEAIELKIDIANALTDTPAAVKIESDKQAHAKAKSDVDAHPTIGLLKTELNATLLEESITPGHKKDQS